MQNQAEERPTKRFSHDNGQMMPERPVVPFTLSPLVQPAQHMEHCDH